MAVELLMPKMGMTMEEGTILRWLKNVGDKVNKGEILLEIQTDKVKMEIESPADGTLLKVVASEGSVIPVNIPIAYIGEEGETVSLKELEPVVIPSEAPFVTNEKQTVTDESGTRVKATPAAKRVAREKGINLEHVKPSSADGIITVADIELIRATPLAKKIAADKGIELAAVRGTGTRGKVTSADIYQSSSSSSSLSTDHVITPLSGLRKVIAERMSISWQNAPQALISLEADMTEMTKLRKQLMPSMEGKVGIKVSFNHLLIRVVAQALKDNPVINARFINNGIEVVEQANIGVAVAAPDGLIVPVLHGSEQLNLEEIVVKTEALIDKARSGQLVLNELEGGTFTISNLGMFGITTFSPILNPPEVGILGAGKISERAIVEEGVVVVRPMMTLSLVFDHRAVDGSQASLFLAQIKELLETPLKLL